MKKQRGTAHFTLIELLITIAILAILCAMLLPALNKARMTAYKVQCLGNVKNMGLAHSQYTTENQEYFIVTKIGTTAYYWFSNQHFARLMGRRTYGNGVSPIEKKVLCPWRFQIETPTSAGQYPINYSYTINQRLANDIQKTQRVKRPSLLPLFLDGVGDAANPGNADPAIYAEYLETLPSPAKVRIAYRHPAETANVIFFDGHAESAKPSKLYPKDKDWYQNY